MLNFDKAQKLFDTIKTIDRIKNSDDDDRIDALFTAIKDIDRKDIGHEFEDIIIDSMRDALYKSYKEEIDRMNSLVDKPNKTALETLSDQHHADSTIYEVRTQNIEIPNSALINPPLSFEEVKDLDTLFNMSVPKCNKDQVSNLEDLFCKEYKEEDN
jgi:hypothetical protein